MSSHNTQKGSISQIPRNKTGNIFSGVFPVQKMRGETLGVLLARFRTEHSLDDDIPLTYAGRLDPMADGLVIILASEARFQKDKMLGLDKVYEMKILLGISTDSLDTLGMIENTPPAGGFSGIEESKIRDVLGQMTQIKTLPYPMYSSRPVDGKPLFAHARAGTDVQVPDKKVKIFSVELLGIEKANFQNLVEQIKIDIDKVQGDFRQDDIKKSWEKVKGENQEVILINIKARVSSGTYMRSLAKWVGDKLSVPTLAYSITRLSVGEF